jgi:hypothetical protein
MSKSRVWLFRGIVVVVVGLMLASWFLPWWAAKFSALPVGDAAIIHPFGLWVDVEGMGGFAAFIKGAGMPGWFAPLMWTYLGICTVALLYGSWLGEKSVRVGRFYVKLSKLLIGGVGISYIVIAVLAVIVAAIQTGHYYGSHLLGVTYFEEDYFLSASLQPGYYMAHGVGLLCIALALLHDKIMGKPKLAA